MSIGTALWAPIANTFSDFWILAIGTFIAHKLIWLVCNLPYIFIEKYSLFKDRKIQPNRKNDLNEMMREFWKSFREHFIIVLPMCVFLGYPIFKYCNFQTGLEFPSWSKFGAQFVFFNLLEDALFYWVHRLFHHKTMFRKYHYIHHKYNAPYSLVGEIAHPMEFVCNFLLPALIPPLIAGLYSGIHITTLWIWLLFREMRGTEAHSGYVLPWHLTHVLKYIGYQGATFHDLHHSSGKGNFGSYIYWDVICGTYTPK
jgi:methylsterol monooxygenase